VISSTLAGAEWTNSTVLDGDLVTEVTKLREPINGDILVHGSLTLVQGLIEQDLVDELRLLVYPVVLGTGRRLSARSTTSAACADRGEGLRGRGHRPRLPAGGSNRMSTGGPESASIVKDNYTMRSSLGR
jgi:RibD domain-containing protein